MKLLPAFVVAATTLFVGCTAIELTPEITPGGDETSVELTLTQTPIQITPTPASTPNVETIAPASPSVTRETEACRSDTAPGDAFLFPTRTLFPTPTPEELGPYAPVEIEFPEWVDQCPGLASAILESDAIALVTFAVMDSEIQEEESGGFFVDLTYTFEAMEYLKGSGQRKIVVRLGSGPKYEAFPDWEGYRTEEEAEQLEASWHGRNLANAQSNADGILFVSSADELGVHSFLIADHGQGWGGEPIMGQTWLGESGTQTYIHGFAGGENSMISLADLKTFITDIQTIAGDEYASCVNGVVSFRDRVRDQILGTHQVMTLAGYADPIPFPKYSLTLDPENSYGFPLRRERPSYVVPRFSHYWLDGPDKQLFATSTWFEFSTTLEIVYPVTSLPPGEYNVYYSQYHQSVPCIDSFYAEDSWLARDVLELVITVPES